MMIQQRTAHFLWSLTLIFFLNCHETKAQEDSSYKQWLTVDFQPSVLIEPRIGGFKMGLEYPLSDQFAVRSDFCYRFVPNRFITLQTGETNNLYGFQIQPSFKYYIKNHHETKNKFAKKKLHSLEFKSGYARYYNEVESWFWLLDGQGNQYQKLLGYKRLQNNFDASVLFNARLYFSDVPGNMGIDFFIGLGLRLKTFNYKNASPELDLQIIQLRDQQNNIGLNQEGLYPLVPMGARIFYIID